MRYISTFSGIEAASVAWDPLGWKPAGFSEIDPFASALLAHRFPGVTNYGDITKHAEWDIGPGAADLLVGGSPCQAFSVAGLRKGLDDPRGQLTLVYLQLAARLEPEWIVWENVPGVLSADGGRAFGAFLGGLAELGYGFAYRVLDARHFGVPQRRRRVFVVARRAGDWESCAKVLLEPEGLPGDFAARGEAGQAFARAAADGARPSGMWWDGTDCDSTLTRKGFGQRMPDKANFFGVLQDEVNCLDTECGGQKLATQTARAGHLIPMGFVQEEVGALCAVDRKGANNQYVDQNKLIVMHGFANGDAIPFRKSRRAQSADDHETWVDDGTANTLNGFDVGDVRTTHAVAIQGNLIGRDAGGPQGIGVSDSGTMYTLTRGDVHGVAIPIQDGRDIEKRQNGFGVGDPNDPAYTIDTTGAQAIAFCQAADVRTGRLTGDISGTICAKGTGGWSTHMINPVIVPHAFYSTGGSHGLEPHPGVSPPLKVGSSIGIPSPPAVAYPIDYRNAMRDPEKRDEMNRQGVGVGNAGDPAHTATTACVHAVAVDVYNQTVDGDCAATVTAAAGGTNTSGPKVATGMVVRRLTPVECERLQGFPDGWTDIPYRGKPAPDGPRYKALGNSMAVPCMAWIGKRIQMVKDGLL